jgi:hypothetical protein
MSALSLHRIDHDRRMARFYRLDTQRDLFGAWCFIREWGRLGRAGNPANTPTSGGNSTSCYDTTTSTYSVTREQRQWRQLRPVVQVRIAERMNPLKLGSILTVKQLRDTADEGETATLVRITQGEPTPVYILLYEHLGYEGFTPAQLAEEIPANRPAASPPPSPLLPPI